MKKVISGLLCAALLSACATRSADISPAYVSPMQYSSYDCDQLRSELMRVSARVHEVARAQDKKANEDAWATGIGLVVFWPALFFLMSDDRKEELSRLKGEYDALEQNAVEKKCPVMDEINAAKAAAGRKKA